MMLLRRSPPLIRCSSSAGTSISFASQARSVYAAADHSPSFLTGACREQRSRQSAGRKRE
jgi:hypothetical protein